MPDIEICRKAGEIRRLGYNINDPIDRIIAATAIILEIPLITYNPKDLDKIKGLRIITKK